MKNEKVTTHVIMLCRVNGRELQEATTVTNALPEELMDDFKGWMHNHRDFRPQIEDLKEDREIEKEITRQEELAGIKDRVNGEKLDMTVPDNGEEMSMNLERLARKEME